MERQGRYVDVKTTDGKVLLSLYFNPGSGIVLESRLDGKAGQGQESKVEKDASKGNGGNGAGEPMTYPQKRLLFRLMAQQGIEGDAAQAELIKLFQVETLKEVTKSEASRMIERLLKEAKEGGEKSGIPF